MTPAPLEENTLSPWAVLAMSVLAGTACLITLTGGWPGLMVALVTAVTEGGTAALVFLAAAGVGVTVGRRLLPDTTPTGLALATGCMLGLWILSTAMLILGSVTTGLLTGWVWWPVVAMGLILAARWIQMRRVAPRWPRRVDGRALIWVVLAAAVGLWLVGATRPAGLVGVGAAEHDVLINQLQAPREYYDAGRIESLDHNVYSFSPGGAGMLSLLCMALRGGPYAGMYSAKFIHGMFAVLAAVGVLSALRDEQDLRGRFGAALIITTPILLELSWLAKMDLAQIASLTLAALWLRVWLAEASGRAAACVAVCVGAACATNYMAAVYVAAPVAAAPRVRQSRGRLPRSK